MKSIPVEQKENPLEFALDASQIEAILDIQERKLNRETCEELICQIVDLFPLPEYDEQKRTSLFDRVLWSTKGAYLIGYKDALEIVAAALKLQLDDGR